MPPTADQITAYLRRLRRRVDEGRIQFTRNANLSIEDMEWTQADATEQVRCLRQEDFLRVETSTVDESMIWVFTPDEPWFGRLWIRLVERAGITVVSFHPG